MDSYNTPSKETIEKVSRESMVTKLEKTNVETPVDSTPKSAPKIKPFAKSANISSTISLLDKIDNFSYQDDTEEVNESVEETKTPAVENSTSTENKKPSIITKTLIEPSERGFLALTPSLTILPPQTTCPPSSFLSGVRRLRPRHRCRQSFLWKSWRFCHKGS